MELQSDIRWYYKVQQLLYYKGIYRQVLQSAASVISKCDRGITKSDIITKCDRKHVDLTPILFYAFHCPISRFILEKAEISMVGESYVRGTEQSKAL